MADDIKDSAAAAAVSDASLASRIALDAAAAGEAREYLKKQNRLADLQIETLEKKDEFELSHLRFRRFSDYARFSLEIAGFLIVLLIVCGLISMVWTASRDRGLVVDAFSVPPDLAQTGMTGSVVANRLIDRLGKLQASSFAVVQGGESYRRDASEGARVEIPETGISVGELQRYLRDWLGHDVHASGEVVRTTKGWSLTVRYGDQPGDTFVGNDLDALIGQGGERLMSHALPYRYIEYLARHQHFAEALAILPSIVPHGSAVDRGRAYATWATLYFYQGDMRQSMEKAQTGLAIDPNNPALYGYLAAAGENIGREETSWNASAGVSSHMRGEAANSLDPAVAEVLPVLFGSYHAENAGDYNTALAGWSRLSGMDTSAYDAGAQTTDAIAAHDMVLAQKSAASIPAKTRDGGSNYEVPLERMVFAYTSGDWAAAVRAGANTEIILKTKSTNYWERVIFVWPLLAESMAHNKDFANAEALIAKTPLDCDDCVRKRGRIAALKHDWVEAAHWFALVSTRSLDIPFADADWGAMLIAKGDLDGAIAKFTIANQKGPHFADALEMWGEALIAKNRSDLALAKFAEADKYAPNWGRLHLKWGEALWWSGDNNAAKKQFAIAHALDLTQLEKAELAKVARG